MYGLVNKAVEQMVCTHFGPDVWETIRAQAGVEAPTFVAMQSYPDDVTYRLVDSASATLGQSHADILRAFGHYWTLYTSAEGYGDMFALTGATLVEFLQNLDNLHARVGLSYPQLRPPSFSCTDVTDDSLLFHYYSERPGLTPMVVGLVEGLAEMYRTPATIEVVASRADGADHDTFRIRLGAP